MGNGCSKARSTGKVNSSLLHEFGLQHEGALVGLAVHLMVTGTFWQANAFDLGAFF
jgi:hypothetical protein